LGLKSWGDRGGGGPRIEQNGLGTGSDSGNLCYRSVSRITVVRFREKIYALVSGFFTIQEGWYLDSMNSIWYGERRLLQMAFVHLSQSSLCFFWNASIMPIARSYVHIVTALAGAAFRRLTVRPRYKPRRPSCFHICDMVLMTPVYVGMFRWTYRSRIGPWTCSRFRVVSRG
jgi:hypothetical protein